MSTKEVKWLYKMLSMHLEHVILEERVDGLEVGHAQVKERCPTVFCHLHSSAADMVGLAEGNACGSCQQCLNTNCNILKLSFYNPALRGPFTSEASFLNRKHAYLHQERGPPSYACSRAHSFAFKG